MRLLSVDLSKSLVLCEFDAAVITSRTFAAVCVKAVVCGFSLRGSSKVPKCHTDLSVLGPADDAFV